MVVLGFPPEVGLCNKALLCWILQGSETYFDHYIPHFSV